MAHGRRHGTLLSNIRLKNIAKQIQAEFDPAEQAADFQGDIRQGLGRQSTTLGGNITQLGDEPEAEKPVMPISIDDDGLPSVNPDFDLTSIGAAREGLSPATNFFKSILVGVRRKKEKERIEANEQRAESVTAFQKRLSATSLGRRSTTNRRANLLRSQFDEEDLRLGVL